MEEQKKKYLLSRIKKEELIIESEYSKFRSIYQGKQMTEERNQPYVASISHLVQLNNTFASELIEYLQKKQIKAVFNHFNTIFDDLLGKYRTTYQMWVRLDKDKLLKEVKSICQICHEEIENNRIENIRSHIDQESETRATLIKNLIEETEKERVRPLFTEDQDKHFKEELQKVLLKKEMALETNITESSIFLEQIANQLANFMLDFKKEFGEWEVKPIKEGANWTQLMKNYVGEKLTGSFGEKMPVWIKKMHDVFIENQPKKPKIYYCNKNVQTIDVPTQGEVKARKEMDEMKEKMAAQSEEVSKKLMQAQRVKQINEQLKAIVRNLKSELQLKQSQFLDFKASQRMLSSHKELAKPEKLPTTKQIPTFKEITPAKEVEARQSKKSMVTAKKISKILSGEYSHNRINTQSITEPSRQEIEEEMEEEEREEKANLRVSLHMEQKKERGKGKQQANREERPSQKETGMTKLKKKVYRGNTREQIIGSKPENQKQGIKQHKQMKSNVSSPLPHLKQEMKQIVEELKGKIKNTSSPVHDNSLKRYNSISILKSNRNSKNYVEQKQSKHVSSLYRKEKEQTISFSQVGIQVYIPEGTTGQEKKVIKFKESEERTSLLVKNLNQNIALIKNELEKIVATKNLQKIHNLAEVNQMLEEYLDQQTVLLTECKNQNKQKGNSPVNEPNNVQKGETIENNEKNPTEEGHEQCVPKKDAKLQYMLENKQKREPLIIKKEPSNFEKMLKMPKIGNKSELINDLSYDDRKNKSLCVPSPKGKQNSLKLPKLSLHSNSYSYENENGAKSPKSSRIINNILNQQYSLLFIEDKFAQKYQQSFDQLANKRERSKPTPPQFHLIQEMFAELEIIKKNKKVLYGQIGILLRYPITEAKNNFLAVNLVRNLTFQDFVNYFLKILWIHRKCNHIQHSHFCQHITGYHNKLKQMSNAALST